MTKQQRLSKLRKLVAAIDKAVQLAMDLEITLPNGALADNMLAGIAGDVEDIINWEESEA